MGCDFLVVGAGIAGASAGYFLSAAGRVTVLEMTTPGYHSTGRSAALFSEYLGNATVRSLTSASRAFFERPPTGFTTPLLTPRGVLALCPPGGQEQFAADLAAGRDAAVPVREVALSQAMRLCPVLRPDTYCRAMLKPGAMDIDVDALHQGFLRGIRSAGGTVVPSARLSALARSGRGWRAVTAAGEFTADVVVNAGGAWADEVAALAGAAPVGLTPLRRTAVLIAPPAGLRVTGWPMVTEVTGTLYFKPESGRLLVSPADETPVPAGDARPEPADVAIALDRMRTATTLPARHVQHAWAGLRTAAPDGSPVIGAAPGTPGFFWVAGLGGFGIQSAPVTGRLAAALVTGAAAAGRRPGLPDPPAGVELGAISPGRFA